MPLSGTAALAMWWDIAPEVRSDFADWHAHEHFPERLSVPGFRRASRWQGGDAQERMFVLYELADRDVLGSPSYLSRLNAPSDWSTKLMPHHRHMIRSQCRVLESHGGLTARSALTVRLSPQGGQETPLRRRLGDLARSVSARAGLVGMHLLRHDPPRLEATTEQGLRGHGDLVADWVVVASGYDRYAVSSLGLAELGDASLIAIGAAPGSVRQLYDLAYAAGANDVAEVEPSSSANRGAVEAA